MAAVPEPRGGALPADELPRMSLLDHLEDLRKRIVYSAVARLLQLGAGDLPVLRPADL